MAAVELDPLFMKALKLLQSKAKDSSSQLKAMLDDAIAQRKGLKLPSQSGDHEKPGLSKTKSDTDLKRKEGEKRPHDKSVKDPFEPDIKRSKFEQLKQQKEKEAKEKEREKLKKEKERKEKEEAQRQKDKAEKERKEKELAAAKQDPEIISDEEETAQQMDAGDFAIDLGIACVVCRQFDVSSGNQLVECQECHSLYHQECHKPTVTDVSDPRFVWYCSRCTKSFKKMISQKPVKPSKSAAPLTSTAKEPAPSSSKSSKTEPDSGSQAFRRMDPKAIVTPKDPSSLTSSSKAMVGLAGLAANLTKPRGESKSSSSSKKSSEHKGDNSKSSSSKSETKMSGSKQDNSTKQSPSSTKSDSRKTESSKSSSSSSSKEESRDGKKSESSKSSKPDSSLRKEEKKEKSDSSGKSSKEDKKFDKLSPKHCASSNSNSNSPPAMPVSPDGKNSGGSSSSGAGGATAGGNSSNNKQAVANLSMVTANKRIQMMKKKAQSQTKPQEKRVHIK